jgi:SAM-dependent methyltransferase
VPSEPPHPKNPWLARPGVAGDDYDTPYEQKSAAGENVHGEADFVQTFGPRSMLDAGCGTGRIAIELARRGIKVVGVDLDPRMLDTGRRKAPHLEWHLGDLSTIHLGRQFDLVLMAGNVMIFLTPGSHASVVENLASHIVPGGHLVAGFQLVAGGFGLPDYDRLALAAGLVPVARYATWNRDPWRPGDSYAVSVHARPT